MPDSYQVFFRTIFDLIALSFLPQGQFIKRLQHLPNSCSASQLNRSTISLQLPNRSFIIWGLGVTCHYIISNLWTSSASCICDSLWFSRFCLLLGETLLFPFCSAFHYVVSSLTSCLLNYLLYLILCYLISIKGLCRYIKQAEKFVSLHSSEA